MREPEFLDLQDVLLIHARQLAEHGGQEGIRDQGLLESAIAMAQASFGGEYLHEDVFAMAAAYAFHIAQNQSFVDGNKRTALACAIVFLAINGVRLWPGGIALYTPMIAIAERRMDKAGLAASFRELGAAP
jgi:death-on-curing protein